MSNVKNFTEQGGERTVIGGELRIAAGGQITPASGVRPAAITDIATAEGPLTTEEREKINAALDALRGVGILPAS